MSEMIVFGTLRIVRLFVGIYMGLSVFRVLAGFFALLHVHENPSLFLGFFVAAMQLVASATVFEGLRQLIHKMHRSSFGKPHPALIKILSL